VKLGWKEFWSGNLLESSNLEDRETNGRITLMWH